MPKMTSLFFTNQIFIVSTITLRLLGKRFFYFILFFVNEQGFFRYVCQERITEWTFLQKKARTKNKNNFF